MCHHNRGVTFQLAIHYYVDYREHRRYNRESERSDRSRRSERERRAREWEETPSRSSTTGDIATPNIYRKGMHHSSYCVCTTLTLTYNICSFYNHKIVSYFLWWTPSSFSHRNALSDSTIFSQSNNSSDSFNSSHSTNSSSQYYC